MVGGCNFRKGEKEGMGCIEIGHLGLRGGVAREVGRAVLGEGRFLGKCGLCGVHRNWAFGKEMVGYLQRTVCMI